jgi:hypothetical protein
MSLMAIRSMISGNVTNEIAHITLSGRPRTHQTVNIGLDKFVEAPAARLEPTREFVVYPSEYRICLHRGYNLDVRLGLQTIRKLARSAIGVLGIPQPYVPDQKSQPLRRQKAHL